MYFLRKAQELYSIPSPKELSPSFWESEGKSSIVAEGLEDILSGIEHPLGSEKLHCYQTPVRLTYAQVECFTQQAM